MLCSKRAAQNETVHAKTKSEYSGEICGVKKLTFTLECKYKTHSLIDDPAGAYAWYPAEITVEGIHGNWKILSAIWETGTELTSTERMINQTAIETAAEEAWRKEIVEASCRS